MTIETAKNLISQQDFGGAKKVLERLLVDQPNNRYLHYELAKIALSTKDFSSAKARLLTVLEIKPDWAGAHMLLGVSALSMGDKDAAIFSFIRAIETWSGDNKQEYVKFFCSMCDDILDRDPSVKKTDTNLDVVWAICEKDEEINLPNSWNSLYKGCVEFCRGNFDSSVSYFSRVSERGTLFFGRHASGSQSMRSSHHMASLRNSDSSSLAKFDWLNKPTIRRGKYVILVSCDSEYFSKFAEISVKTILKNTSADIHVNIVDPSIENLDFLSAIIDDSGSRVFSTKQSFVGSNTRCFYACSRFFILPALMDFYQVPVITVDADSAFVDDLPEDFFCNSNGIDFSYKGVGKAKLSHFPWRSIAAGFTVFNSTSKAKLLAEYWRDYLVSVFSADANWENYWYIDQSAMVCLLSYFGENLSSQDLGNSTSKFCVFPDARRETKEEFVKKYSV